MTALAAHIFPEHAYVPGQNERHLEHVFDAIRQTAAQGLDANQLAQCDAFTTGLQYLHAGYYWEAHEVLEPVWMVLADGSLERQFVKGLIQLANGCLKLRMGRPKAALRLVEKVRELIPRNDMALLIMSTKVRDVHLWVDALEVEINLHYSAK